jgi:hypothetical protein
MESGRACDRGEPLREREGLSVIGDVQGRASESDSLSVIGESL